MEIIKEVVTPIDGGMKFEEDNTWFEFDNSGCLKIKAAMKGEKGMEETVIFLSKKSTENLRVFLDSFK